MREGVFDNASLVVMHSDRFVVETAGTGLLAKSGTDAAGKLRKVIGLQQSCQCMAIVSVHQHIVPLRD